MAKSLGYDYDRTSIKKTSYFPTGYGQMEEDQLVIRRSLAQILSGESHLPIAFATSNDEDEEQQDKWLNMIESYLKHERPIKIAIVDPDTQSEQLRNGDRNV